MELTNDSLAQHPGFGDGLVRVLTDWEIVPAHLFAVTPSELLILPWTDSTSSCDNVNMTTAVWGEILKIPLKIQSAATIGLLFFGWGSHAFIYPEGLSALSAVGMSVDHLSAAKRALQAGRLAEARVELEAALQRQPTNADAYLQLGLLLGSSGNPNAAADAFRKCLQIDPGSPEAHYNLGLTQIADPYGKIDWQGAIAEFRKAIQLQPDYAKAHHSLGAALAETGALTAAIAEFRNATKLDPNSAEDHLDLANALSRAGQRIDALSEYQTALRLRPGYSDAEVGWGILLTEDSGHTTTLDEAIEHFRRALKKDPDNLKAQYRLANALKQKGNEGQATIALREVHELTDRQQESVRCTRLSNEGLDAAHRGDRDSAARILKEAVELKPDAAIAHYNFGLVLADLGDFSAAAAQVVEAISLSPADARFYLSLRRIWSVQGDTTKSRRAFERACRLDPNNKPACAEFEETKLQMPDSAKVPDDPYQFGSPADTADQHFAFGSILANQNDWIGAAGEWLRTLALRPDDVNARNNLAIAYSHMGRDEKAELEFYKVLQVLPESADAHFGLAVLALEHGHNSEAAEELKQVINMRPSDTEAQKLLSLALNKSK